MVNIFKKEINNKFLLLVVCILLNNNTSAECKKEDVDYYLEKGFTTEQVTALCSGDVKTTSKKQEYKTFSDEYADEQDAEYVKKMRIERQVFFKSALNAQNIKIRRNILSFHLYECSRDGLAKPGSDLNVKGCATVLVRINLANVTVEEKVFKEKVVFGTKSILVKGDVVSKIIGGLEGLSDYDRKVLKSKISARLSKNKGEVLVPIKRGLNFSYALESFQEIVAFHKGEINKNKLGGDLGGELEVEDFDNTQEYIIDDGKKKIKLSNDENDTIDGTLVFDDLDTSSPSSSANEIPDDILN